ncbi:unnamed protein product [Phaedon cochleariae]|uniref:CHK kinase-like domain-containing protein n=1 Tax=Phaedon cochleariae TaxID=80249 RepID=A0A9N9X255_PHACE|nr:unnamed protein product [Phaedon cochleariae]
MAVNDKENEDIVKLWIRECLTDNHMSEYEVSFAKISEKGQGYLSDIFFVKATGLNERREKQEFDFVVKISKKNETLRKSFPLRESFHREIYIYNEVIPTFKLFMNGKEAKFKLDFMPECYKTIFEDETEGIILENLKIRGFQLHCNTKPLNLEHIKLVLLNMAHFHAVSFAFRDQNEYEFNKLIMDFNSLLSITVEEQSMQTLFRTEMFTAIEFLKEIDESELAKQLQERIQDDPNAILKSIYNKDIKQSVILHGDTWINNYMFRYEDGDLTTPAAVAFLDWQISSLHSPALDVSQFLYAVSSEEALVTHFEDLMVFYHSKLSSCLRELGSDPENIFPYSLLIEHWKKYSVASLIFVLGFLKTIVSEGDEVPATEDITCGLGDVFSNVKITNMNAYKSRLVAIVKNFCSL